MNRDQGFRGFVRHPRLKVPRKRTQLSPNGAEINHSLVRWCRLSARRCVLASFITTKCNDYADGDVMRPFATHSRHAVFENAKRVGYQVGVLDYVTSSLFESPAQTLVNTVNTVGVMGKGIANDFRRLYPDMFERYRTFCAHGEFSVGQLYLYRTPHKWVLNFPTKVHWRNPSNLEWIESGLQKFLETYSQYGITSVAFPQLGTGNGGLRWSEVQPLMEKYLKQVRVPVYIHLRPHDPNFVPEHLTGAEVPALRRELHTARAEVTFETFVRDLERMLHAKLHVPNDPHELPVLEFRNAMGGMSVVPLERLLDFWQSLKLTGALELANVPAAIRDSSPSFHAKLAALEYIKPMTFGREERPGFRYAPPSLTTPTGTIDVESE